MNRARAMMGSLRLANSFFSTRLLATRQLWTQVIRFPTLSAPPSLSNHSHISHPFITNQKLCYSTNANSIVQLLLANNWSTELEGDFVTTCPKFTHEIVVFVLKKLDKDPQKASDFFNWVCEKNGFRPSSAMYSLLLRILLNKDSMTQFWITLKKIKELGFYIDKETYMCLLGILKKKKMSAEAVAFTHFFDRMVQDNAMDDVVKKAVGVVLGADWNNEIEKELGEMCIPPSDNFVIRVLKELRNYPVKALSFFRWVGCCPDYKHNSTTYNAIARVLGSKDAIKFWSAVEEMKSAGHEMDIDTYIKISRQFQKYKMLEDAVKLYEFMMDGPFKPSIQDCSILLRSISGIDNPDLYLVFRVVKKYEATGHTPSKAIYDGVHRSLARVGKFDEAEKIIKIMRNAGCEPDNITCSQLVFGLCKAGRLEEACRVLDEMEAHGCIPDFKTWSILIRGLCAANEVDKGLLCLAKLIEKNCDVDADLLDVLINGFLEHKRIDDAYTMLVEMVKTMRVRPWQATFKLLIEKLLGVRKLEEAMEILRLMKKQNYPPFSEPFVQYISEFGTAEDAAEFLKALSVKEYPSISAYLNVFESFFKEGRQSEAKDVLFKCPHHIREHQEIGKLFGLSKTDEIKE